jgi:hypothetical protein
MSRLDGSNGWRLSFGRSSWAVIGATLAVVIVPGSVSPTHAAGLVINATFSSSFTATEQAAIQGAINTVEAEINTPITVSIQFQTMTSGLGESSTFITDVSYFDFYNALKAHATSAQQLTAVASLGAPPASSSSPNPVNGSTLVQATLPDLRALGFNASPPTGQPDGIIGINTSITSPPNGLSGNFSLKSVALHEINEVLGTGGTGSTLTGSGSLTGAVGPLDLYRYSASGVRSYSNTLQTNPSAYFSINGGATVLSYFNQRSLGADFGDWLSNPLPPGFSPQVQDAFATPGSNPSEGVNELTALNVVGYSVNFPTTLVPEPSSLTLLGAGMVVATGYGCFGRRRRTGKCAV